MTKGYHTIIDSSDFYNIGDNLWRCWDNLKTKTFYAICERYGKTIGIHRIIMNPENNKIFIDHKNGNALDNRKENLRFCTPTQNSYNSRTNLKKYKGVFFRKDRDRWMAVVSVNGKAKKVGHFKSEIEAAKAYNEAAKKYHGEFAFLNAELSS